MDRMPTANALEVVPRVLIADAYEVVRRGLQRILQTRASLEVVAVARDGRDAIRMAVETKPDIVVIGYALPMINGVEVTRQIRALLPGTEILIFTNQEDVAVIDQLLRAGARGYVLKSDGNDQLIAAIEALAGGRTFFTAKVAEALLHSFNVRRAYEASVLTRREGQVVQLIAEGYTSKAIANLFKVSPKTVEAQRRAIFKKLDLSSTAGLVRYAIRKKIIEP